MRPGSEEEGAVDNWTLTLDEQLSVPLPSDFEAAGVALGARGEMLIWPDSGDKLILLDSAGDVRVLNLQFAVQPIGAGFARDGRVELVESKRILRLGSGFESVETDTFTLAPHLKALTAVRCDDGWCIGATDADSTYWITMLSQSSTDPLLAFTNYEYSGRPRTIYLTAAWPYVFASNSRPPYTIMRVDVEDGGRLPFLPAPPIALQDDVPDKPPVYRALRLLPLDKGYIQTWSDLRSDSRYFVLSTDSFERVASRHVDAPLAIVATFPERRAVAAVRTTDVSDVIIYRVDRSEHPVGHDIDPVP